MKKSNKMKSMMEKTISTIISCHTHKKTILFGLSSIFIPLINLLKFTWKNKFIRKERRNWRSKDVDWLKSAWKSRISWPKREKWASKKFLMKFWKNQKMIFLKILSNNVLTKVKREINEKHQKKSVRCFKCSGFCPYFR